MFRHSHPFTWISVVLTALGVGLAGTSAGAMAPVAFLLAQVCALTEFKKYTSRFQFSMILVNAGLLGAMVDMRSGQWGMSTAPLVLCAVVVVLRQAYMPVFTHVRHLWSEPVLIAVSAAFLAHTWTTRPFGWETHAYPMLSFAAACFLAASYLQDAVMIKRRTRNGYRVRTGMVAPDFVLPDQTGNSVHLADYRSKHPVLLIFVRGDWCPGCHMMLRTYERNNEKFKARGIHVLGIGPDSVEVNKDMVERIGVGYKLLSDTGQQTSQRYGVIYDNPALGNVLDYAEGIPLPASFLVDEQGVVRYVSRPDRVGEFLDPSLIFNVLDQLPAVTDDRWKAA